MKKAWAFGTLAAFVVALGGFVAAQQGTTRPTDQKPAAKKEAKAENAELPATITTAFKKSYPNATIRGTAKETEGGKTVYEVESVDKGKARDLMYNVDGTVISIEEEVNAADLPAPVTAALKRLYPKATITVAEKLTEGTKIGYELQIKGAAVTSVAFMPDGTPVPPEAPEKK
jgi:hypothetical protein